MKTFLKTVKGSITVFVTLILVPSIFFTGFMVDLARLKLYGNQAVMTADNYGETVLSQYDNLLKELYGLFAVTQDEEALKALDNLQGYVSSSFDPTQNNISWEHFKDVQDYFGTNTLDGFMPYQNADITLEKEFINESSLSNHAVLDTQIGDFMRFRIAQGLLDDGSDIVDTISEVENMENDGKAIDKKLEMDDEVEKLLDYAQDYYKILKEIQAYVDYIDDVNKQYQVCKDTFKDLEETDAYKNYQAYVLADEDEMSTAVEKRSHNLEDEENAVELTEEEEKLLVIFDNYINDSEAREEKFKTEIESQTGLLEVIIAANEPINHSNFDKRVDDLKKEADQINKAKTKLDTLKQELEQILSEGNITSELKTGIESQLEKVNELFSELTIYTELAEWIAEKDMPVNQEYKIEMTDLIDCMDEAEKKFLAGETYADGYKEPINGGKWYLFESISKYGALYNSLEKCFEGEGDDSNAKSKKKAANTLKKEQQKALEQDEPTNARDIPEAFHYGMESSSTGFDIKNLISSASDLFRINGLKNQANKLILKLYTVEYDFGMFSSRTTNVRETEEKAVSLTGYEMNRKLNYLYQAELEYLLGGYNSSKDNLNAARNKILAIRAISNYTATYSIKEIDSTIRSISTAAYAINPVLGLTVENALRLAVATAETVSDWDSLKDGKKVVLAKMKKEDLTAPDKFADLLGMNVSASGQDKGIDYDMYLKIMLIFFPTADQLTERTGNLIELDVNAAQRNLEENEDLSELQFQLDKAYTAVNASCTVKLGFVVMPDQFAKKVTDSDTYQSITDFEKNGYKFTVTRGY